MKEDAVAAAQRQLDAYNAGDVDAFLEAYTSDCEIRAHPSGRMLMSGHDEMRERYGRLFRENPDLHCRLLHRITHECFVIDHEEVTGRGGAEVVYAVATYEVRDGLIRKVWFLRDD
jgi:hypothetical protein